MEFDAWCKTISIQVIQKTIQQCAMHFGYPKMHLVSHIPESNRWIGLGDNFTTDISGGLHMTNVKEAYRSSNKLNCIRQMLKHNDQCASLHHMEETLLYHALQGWYNIDSANVFNLLSATDKRRSTCRVHLFCLQTIEDETFIRPVSQQENHSRETHVSRVCRSFKLTSHRDASENVGIPNFQQLFCAHTEEDWGHEVSGFVLGYDQNVLLDSTFIKLQNGQL